MAEIFDRMVAGINKGAASLGESSKVFMEKAKLNTEISNLDREKKQLLELLGARIFELYGKGLEIPEELHNFCNEIAQRNSQISVAQAKIAELDARKNLADGQNLSGIACECGFRNNEGARFCVKCGKQLK